MLWRKAPKFRAFDTYPQRVGITDQVGIADRLGKLCQSGQLLRANAQDIWRYGRYSLQAVAPRRGITIDEDEQPEDISELMELVYEAALEGRIGADEMHEIIHFQDEDVPYLQQAGNILYATMALDANVRPPLTSEWESQRINRFEDRDARTKWMAGRTLAKTALKTYFPEIRRSIPDIRDDEYGRPHVWADGRIAPDMFIDICVRHGRVAAVASDKPVGLALRQLDEAPPQLIDHLLTRGERELLLLSVKLHSPDAAESWGRAGGWALKEAAVRAMGLDCPLHELRLSSKRQLHAVGQSQACRTTHMLTSGSQTIAAVAVADGTVSRFEKVLDRIFPS